jgi:ribosomal RNA assembly protein
MEKDIDQFTYELRVPKERVAVLIGKNGETKKELEVSTSTKINVDSHEGDIFIEGNDPLKLFTAREIIKAVGRGFNPETAKLLLKADYTLDMLSMGDYAKTKNDMLRLKGRVIGAEGKSRMTIESLTDTFISVYGKTISIIGEAYNVSVCRRAVESLLTGSPHSNVYQWLEKQRREMKKRDILGGDYGRPEETN